MTYPPPPVVEASPWLTVAEAARRAKCCATLIYRAVAAGKLKAARLRGGRGRALRIHVSWLDAWIEAAATDVELVNEAAGPAVPFRRR